MKRIWELTRRKERVVAGCLSGTSADGVSVALVRIRGAGPGASVVPLASGRMPYPPRLRERLLHAPRLEAPEIARLDVEVAEVFARAVRRIARARPDLVGSHGQTIYHGGGAGVRATLQVGDGDVIAERLRVPVVSDFRARDVAAGGAGAPLTPYADFVLFGGKPERAILNLGGIANLTLLGRRLEEVEGFDTGPGNMVLDGLVRAAGKGRLDAGGRRALRGRLLPDLLAWMGSHPFLRKAPPKSTGREEFGENFVRRLRRRAGRARLEDLLATAAEFTAECVARAIRDFVSPRRELAEVLVAGGGVRNRALMRALARRLAPLAVRSTAVAGVDPDAREAIALAILANDALFGLPTGLPRVTGARRAVTLGKISLP